MFLKRLVTMHKYIYSTDVETGSELNRVMVNRSTVSLKIPFFSPTHCATTIHRDQLRLPTY